MKNLVLSRRCIAPPGSALLAPLIVLVLSLFSYAQRQRITISGTVVDENGTSLPGVNVLEKGISISVVDVEAIMDIPKGNPMAILQGRVPGLFVEQTGRPSGQTRDVMIRGLNTLGAHSPLYIIDGVATKRATAFSSLNVNSIESIQVLKECFRCLYIWRQGLKRCYHRNNKGRDYKLVYESWDSVGMDNITSKTTAQTLWYDRGYGNHKVHSPPRLFNLSTDISERLNIAGSHPDSVARTQEAADSALLCRRTARRGVPLEYLKASIIPCMRTHSAT